MRIECNTIAEGGFVRGGRQSPRDSKLFWNRENSDYFEYSIESRLNEIL